MRYQDIYVAGTGAYYPKSVAVDDAIADGHYDLASQRRSGQQRVAIADTETQPEMAVLAGRQARERSGIPANRFGLLLHGVATHNGCEGWNAASYVQQHVIDGHGFSYEIHQQSNSAMGSVQLACSYLVAGGDDGAAMITASDVFGPPAWDRWRSAPRVVYGDGASALALARGAGFARVASVVSVADSDLEGLHRGAQPFTTNPNDGCPINVLGRILEFAERRNLDIETLWTRISGGMRRAGTEACAEAGIAVTDAEHVATPYMGRDMFYEQCLDPLGIDIDKTTWHFGSQVGHAGCTDSLGGFNHLVEEDELNPGERVLMLGVGGGVNWTAVVLEIVERPEVAAGTS